MNTKLNLYKIAMPQPVVWPLWILATQMCRSDSGVLLGQKIFLRWTLVLASLAVALVTVVAVVAFFLF